MESMWAQLLAGIFAVVGLFVAAVLGAVVLACTPLPRPSDDAGHRRSRR